MQKKLTKSNITIIAYIIIFILCQIFTFILSAWQTDFDFGLFILEPGKIISLFTLAQIIITIILVIHTSRSGYILSLLLHTLGLICTTITITKLQNLSALPDIFLHITGMIIVTILYSYIKKLHYIANTDNLTGLPNRKVLIEDVERRIARHKRFAFILIDLDNFKRINDTTGHNNGDAILKEIAQRWKVQPHATDAIFARISGDEFVVVMDTDQSKEALAERIRNSILPNDQRRNFPVGTETFFVSASAGISIYPDDADSFNALFRYADIAMYQIKSSGKQDVAMFYPSYLQAANQEYQVEHQIRAALKNDTFFVLFQPQFNLDTKSLHGAEALVRMKDANGQIVSPGIFIPIAERSNLIMQIDMLVLEKSLNIFKPFLEKDNTLILSVNISVKTLLTDGFMKRVKMLLKKTEYPAGNLELEITESLMIPTDVKKDATNILHQLTELGIQLALDDFGTGYSSLSYLKDLPFDTLKIDKSFIDNLSHGVENNNDFVEAIISLGHLLKFNVVSEGVEKEEQLAILRALQCDIIQGYIWGKPMEASRLEEYISH